MDRSAKPLALCLFLLAFAASSVSVARAADLSADVEVLGAPASGRYPDSPWRRNVWDLQRFADCIYIGSGDSATNAGPVDVWCWNTSRDAFVREGVVQQQQIEQFVPWERTLAIPGHDPVSQAKAAPAAYLRDGGRWRSWFSLTRFAHLYCVAPLEGGVLAGLGAHIDNSLRWTGDEGRNWTSLRIKFAEAEGQAFIIRVHSFLRLGGQLYGSGYAKVLSAGDRPAVRLSHLIRIDSSAQATVMAPSVANSLFPGIEMPQGTDFDDSIRVVRPAELGDQLVYIAGRNSNDHQWIPQGLFVAGSLDDARPVDLGGAPWDTLVVSGICYVLTASPADAGQQRIAVHSSTNLLDWREEFHFIQPTFARSFEFLNNAFYFGLGCLRDKPVPESGNILRLNRPR